jgi:hypothetical protein
MIADDFRQHRKKSPAIMKAVCAAALLGVAACGASPPAQPGHRAMKVPTLRVLTNRAPNGSGDIFLTPHGGGYPSGPEILRPDGTVAWFHPLPRGAAATDFRTQTYRGKPVLTWCQLGRPGNTPTWTDYIYDGHYRQIAAVRAGDGYATDFHEFQITPQNTALITATTVGTANLTSIGGPSKQTVIQDAAEEIDIRTGKVLFAWNAGDHVPYADSHFPLPGSADTPWDWFHINAVHLDTDGSLLIDSRFTWTTYKVSRHTGKVIWELGGKQSSFRLLAAPGQKLDAADAIFAFQHDPEPLGHGLYSLFDDEADQNTALLAQSRAVVIRLNLAAKTATLIRSYNQPAGLVARGQGNAQTTRNGDLFVGWGVLPYISEFSPSGRLLFNAELPAGVVSYRAYRLPWHPAGP